MWRVAKLVLLGGAHRDGSSVTALRPGARQVGYARYEPALGTTRFHSRTVDDGFPVIDDPDAGAITPGPLPRTLRVGCGCQMLEPSPLALLLLTLLRRKRAFSS